MRTSYRFESLVVPSAVTLKIKRDAKGRQTRCKERLVARGKFRTNPVYYTELYAPVPCFELVRVFLSIAVASDVKY